MKTIEIDFNKPDQSVVLQAAKVIKSGGVVVFPSDTVYGLAGDATNPKVIDKILEIKKRTYNKAISTIVRDLEMASEYCEINEKTKQCLERYLPGKVTFILPMRPPKRLPGDNPSIRIPGIPITNELSKLLDFPYTATSANPTTEPDSYSFEDILKYFANADVQPDLFLNAGTLPPNQPSTVVDLTQTSPIILRQGPVQIDLESC